MMINGNKIRKDLEDVGVYVTSIDDLVNTKRSYPAAIPILVGYLEEEFESDNILEAVVRALSVKEARGIAASPLLKLFKKLPKYKRLLRWAIGNAMSVVMTDSNLEEVLPIVKEKENGTSRQMLVLALGRYGNFNSVESTLIELLEDDEVVIHAINALRKIKSLSALPTIRNLLHHSIPVVEELAKEYIEKAEHWRSKTL